MINDFLAIEQLYDRSETALYIDEVLLNYKEQDVTSAIQAGYIQTRTVCIGPNCGRVLCWLTEKGRCKANASMH